jgi:hypothetical protein
MEIKNFIKAKVRGFLNESDLNYQSWKRKNVTLRGMREAGVDNGVYGSFGKGLYTVPLSNKAMAKQYGEVFFVLNGRPKTPKIVYTLNDAEMLVQKLVNDFCKTNGEEYSRNFFDKNTSIEDEMLKLGFDGLIIKGREMVNYKPDNIKYFRTEYGLQDYFERLVNLG